jgi:dihydrofolate synthase/folylpolyglutamate synthase
VNILVRAVERFKFSSQFPVVCMRGSSLGLSRVFEVLYLLGDPQKKLKFVHVAGTNGKGSVSAFLCNILIDAGYKVGLFTSPHINNFSERIKINNKEISEQELLELSNLFNSKVSKMKDIPTVFESITVIAILYFLKNKCDIVVLEVGLGGRLDATNVIDKPEVSVITAINYDHTEILGNTLEKIAFEKAGIIKKNCNVVIYPTSKLEVDAATQNKVKDVFYKRCEELNANLYEIDENDICLGEYNLKYQIFDFANHKNLCIKLLSDFQIFNASLAIKSVELLNSNGFDICENNIRAGLLNTSWPGRFEILRPNFVIDGAHNPHGVRALIRNLKKYFGDKEIIFIVGILRDKDYKLMLKLACEIAKVFITISFENERALRSQEIADYLKNIFDPKKIIPAESVSAGINVALRICKKNNIICSFGSLYYIGDVKKYFANH